LDGINEIEFVYKSEATFAVPWEAADASRDVAFPNGRSLPRRALGTAAGQWATAQDPGIKSSTTHAPMAEVGSPTL
jgi:hypothetical protein